MNKMRTVFEIARWEFMRWFKLRGQLLTLILSVLLSLAFAGGGYLLERGSRKPVYIVVMNEEKLPLAVPTTSRITLAPAEGKDVASLRDAVGRREIDGLLILHSVDGAELTVAATPGWLPELQQLLTAERQRLKLNLLNISSDQLAEATTPFKIDVAYQGAGSKPSTSTERIAAAILIGLMLIGIVFSLGGQLASITGEKQLRVTEQILSAVTPQQWIDGKILGVSLYAAVQTFVLALSTLIFFWIAQMFGQGMAIPMQFANPRVLIVLALCAVGGFFFWNAFLAAVASTMTDPNASSKTGMLFLPLFASLAIAISALKHPESLLTRVFALLPITSPVVLPMRIVLAHTPLWEIVTALGLLFAAVWVVRGAAGKIFRLGMLMYGKEPDWKEMLRWIRET